MSRLSARRLTEKMERLRKQIEQAFVTVQYPGDDNIASYPDTDNVMVTFKGKHWKDITPNTLKGKHWKHWNNILFYNYSSLFLMTNSAFVFYLPAWLIASIDYFEAGMIASVTINALSPCFYNSDSSNYFVNRAKSLNLTQCESIYCFLRYLVDEYDLEILDYKNMTDHTNETLDFWSARGSKKSA